MRIALNILRDRKEDMKLAKQVGVDYAVRGGCEFGGADKPWHLNNLKRLKMEYAEAGLELIAYENLLPPKRWRRIVLNRPNRDMEIERFCEALRNMGEVGVPIVSWNWDAYMWSRTDTEVEDRGGSLVTEYDHEVAKERGGLEVEVDEDEIWEGIRDFLDRTVPVAEESGVTMALHPDDPPLPSLKGIPRIVNSVEAFDKILKMHPSENHGINFCQGCFSLMDVDLPDAIRHFGDKIKFAHFRDVEGNARKFRETWHDEGPHDMLSVVKAYHDIGFEGPIRPDHVPTMEGEENEHPGYEIKGRLFAVGYMSGLMECVNAET